MSNQEMKNMNPLKKIENSLTQEQSLNIDEVFKDNPKISILFKNNKELYQEYLNSIFPDSKIKDIVWHGTKGDWYKTEKFNSDFSGTGSGNKSNTEGFYFIKYKRATAPFGDKKTVFPALLNIKNPNELPLEEFNKTWFDKENYLNLKKGDGIVAEQEKSPEEYYKKHLEEYNEAQKDEDEITRSFFRKPNSPEDFHEEQLSSTYVAFDSNQIHILGSNKDIEQVKEWLKNKEI